METGLTVLAIAALVGVGAVGYRYWRAAHSKDVRRIMVDLRELLTSVVAAGGLSGPDFLAEDRQRAAQELDNLVGLVHDGRLRRGCHDVLDGYWKVFASAPPASGAVLWDFDDSRENSGHVEEQRQRAGHHHSQVENARTTLDEIRRVMDRLNTLERFLPRRG
ncbi:MAG: hypothetical protein M3046_02675 [Actinomycetota bacterium]|nr:hypothetical protein [Actinomycetota bacterium]